MSRKSKVDEIIEITKLLKKTSINGNLSVSDDQLMKTATEIVNNETSERLNQILQSAFVISDSSPSAIEAIAMQLGYKWNDETLSISEAIVFHAQNSPHKS